MRIVHFNYHLRRGGAAAAVLRLHTELLRKGVDSVMCVADDDGMRGVPGTVLLPRPLRLRCRLRQRFESMLLRCDGGNDPLFPRSLNPAAATGAGAFLRSLNPDAVNLHWIGGGMVGLTELAELNLPTLWTLHDCWAICATGHYHRSGDRRFISGYGNGAPALDRINFERKRKAWMNWRPRIITPSRWLGNEVSESALLGKCSVTVIPNGIDLRLWRNFPKAEARTRLGLPAEGKILLFAADDLGSPNKGGGELLEVLRILRSRRPDLRLLTVGCGKVSGSPLETIAAGYVCGQEKMNLLYSASDCLLLTSKLDNLPNSALEAAACGTPAVGFDCCGIPDAVVRGGNGELAAPGDIAGMAAAVEKILSGDPENLRVCSRHTAETRFDISGTTEKYLEIYRSVISSR